MVKKYFPEVIVFPASSLSVAVTDTVVMMTMSVQPPKGGENLRKTDTPRPAQNLSEIPQQAFGPSPYPFTFAT